MLLHHAERVIALLHPVFERVLLQFAPALDQREPEIRRAEIGLEAVLLEEHPLQRSARSMRSSGASGVPPAMYQRMAFDSAR